MDCSVDTHYFRDPSGTDIEPVAQESVGGGHDHGHDHGGGGSLSCGCESQEADHPFTINCTDVATIRSAGVTLSNCNGGVPAQSACEGAVATDPTCQIAFFVIQAHHDHCPHDTLVRRVPRSHQRPASLALRMLDMACLLCSLLPCSHHRPPRRSRCSTIGRARALVAPSRVNTTRRSLRVLSSTARTRARPRPATLSSRRRALLVARAARPPPPRTLSTL